MAAAAIARAGAEILPFVLQLFGKGPEAIDTEATLRGLIEEFQKVLGPVGEGIAQQAVQSGAQAGTALRQDVADSTGRIGGGSAGTTRVNRGLAASAGTRFAGAAGADARFKVAQSITALANQALPAALNAQTQTQARTGADAVINNLLGGLAGVTAADGKNPFRTLIDQILKGSGPGENPFTADDLANLMQSPLVSGFKGGPGGSTPQGGFQAGNGARFGSNPASARRFLGQERSF